MGLFGNQPWASAVVLVRKRDGSLRFYIDLRKLNARTIKDVYSLPCIEESLDCLNGAQIFTSLDLKSGYWQIELSGKYSSYHFHCWTIGILEVYTHAIWSHKCTCDLLITHGVLPQRYALGLVHYLLR